MYDADEMLSTRVEFEGTLLEDGRVVFAQTSAHGTSHPGAYIEGGVTFEQPIRRTSPGQTIVLYGRGELEDCVIGGGTITGYS